MPEENNFNNAMSLLIAGRRKEAAVELLNLYQRTTKKSLRLQLIEALMSALNHKRENQKLIDLSSEGIKFSEDLQLPALQAHFMSRKAEFLSNKSSLLHCQRAELKLAPGWLGFSTEAERISYDSLTAEIKSLEKETDRLLSDATTIAKLTGKKKVLGFILMSKGYVESSRYLDCKLKCIDVTWKSKVRLLFYKWGFEIPLLFGFKRYKRLKTYVDSFTKSYLEAVRLLEEIDDLAAGSAYYNLAVHLKMAYKFRQAKNYLRKAKFIAEKHRNTSLRHQINELKKSIKARNRDIPNYLEGETRAGRD